MIQNDFTATLPLPEEALQTNSPSPTKPPQIPLMCRLEAISSRLCNAQVTVAADIVQPLKEVTIDLFAHQPCDGFALKQAPRDYLTMVYQCAIEQKISNFLLRYLVLDQLVDHVIKNKTLMANYPRLHTKHDLEDGGLSYQFELSMADQIDLKEWRNFAFRPPKRKKYKDLDKQVSNFLEQNAANERSLRQSNRVQEGDWVLFELVLVDGNQAPILSNTNSLLWSKIKPNNLQDTFMRLLIGKQTGEQLVTDHADFEESLGAPNSKRYQFLVTIKGVVKQAFFPLESIRSVFKLKNMTELHNKLIEVFSYRNDSSQRKAIIEELYHLLLSKHRFQVPKHLVLRRQEDLMRSIAQQPDYHVYRSQKDFLQNVNLLAEKQLKEEIITDQIAYREQITVEQKDMFNYFQLLNNKRLKEFIYFKPGIDKLDDPDQPLSVGMLVQAIMREKTLNYMIHTITR